jgi:hypothetical protein
MAAKRGTARVVFDDLAFNDDLGRTTEHGRRIAVDTRSAYEQHGCPVDDLLACQEQATDGTDLPGCAKVYLPAPVGNFGMVFAIKRQEGQLVLVHLAFGVRHHPKGSHALTVYEIAHRRLHEITARDLRGGEPDTPAAGAETEDTPGN